MNLLELFLLAAGLSMDAFAVAVTIGLTLAESSMKKALVVGLYFGAFQAGMPIIGYFAAMRFAERIVAYNHFVAFGLLAFLGGKMILGGRKAVLPPDKQENPLDPRKMLPLALATSIDALAVGISFAFLYVQIVPAAGLIGAVTLIMSMLGVKIGNVFGSRFKSKAAFAGGAILILIGVRVLVEGL